MELTELIKQVIFHVLEKYEQPYGIEFAEFVKHVMSDNYEQEEVVDRIKVIRLKETTQ
ncbi:MAG: hypothetical protein LBC03_06890 [Nitrososphaerota archaeon]|jgi:hypothetical protein|nr:hypothetical protein [Nitrososphaerota archaeon]